MEGDDEGIFGPVAKEDQLRIREDGRSAGAVYRVVPQPVVDPDLLPVAVETSSAVGPEMDE
jgi:hypothetical protein